MKGLLHNRGSTSQKNAREYVGWEAYKIVVARKFEGVEVSESLEKVRLLGSGR